MSTRIITAIPCGKDHHGDPITRRYTYTIDRAPEDWGDNRARIFVQNSTFKDANGKFLFTPTVVHADSIHTEVAA